MNDRTSAPPASDAPPAAAPGPVTSPSDLPLSSPARSFFESLDREFRQDPQKTMAKVSEVAHQLRGVALALVDRATDRFADRLASSLVANVKERGLLDRFADRLSSRLVEGTEKHLVPALARELAKTPLIIKTDPTTKED